MSILISRNIAVFLGIATPLLETIRRWKTWTEEPLSFFDDYLLGGLLLYGAWRVTKDAADGQRYLVLGWAFAFGMAVGGLIAQLRIVRVGEADPAPVSAEWVLVVKLLGMAIILFGLALALRKLKAVDG